MKKVAFVGQKMYFEYVYGTDLDDLYNVKSFEFKFEATLDYYNDLLDFKPDITFFFRIEWIPQEVIDKISGVKVALSSEPIPKYIGGKLISSKDMKIRFKALEEAIGKYDHFYHYDETSIRFLKENGFKDANPFVFPISTNKYKPKKMKKDYDIFFFGRSTPHREAYLSLVKPHYKVLQISHGVEHPEVVEYINRAKVNLNIHVETDLQFEPRIQMLLACKAFVISEPLSNKKVFVKDKHFVEVYNPEDFLSKFEYYLKSDSERESIAENGYELIQEKYQAKDVFPNLIKEIADNEKKE